MDDGYWIVHLKDGREIGRVQQNLRYFNQSGDLVRLSKDKFSSNYAYFVIPVSNINYMEWVEMK